MGQASWILGNGVKPAGGGLARFDAYTSLPASANVGDRVRLKNPLSPTGETEMYWTGTLWAPVAGQILYGAYGTLLDMTAAALSIGAWNEVWQSPLLPTWMFNGDAISLTSEASLADGSSTATEKMRMTVRTVASSAGDENDATLGHIGAATSVGRGLSGIRSRANIRGGVLYGNAGSTPSGTGSQPSRATGSYGPSARIRLDEWPGATTNTTKLLSVELWSGG